MSERTFWNEAYHRHPEYTTVPDRILLHEIRTLALGRALDIGCGDGTNALALARHGWSVTGIDWSDQAVFLAERAAWSAGVQARFEVADAGEWTTTHPFDLVYLTYALPPGGRGAAVLRRAAQSVAPGGCMIVVDWHQSMAPIWELSGCELHTPERIAAAIACLKIDRTEVRRIPDLFEAHDPRAGHGRWADIALVRASRPSHRVRSG